MLVNLITAISVYCYNAGFGADACQKHIRQCVLEYKPKQFYSGQPYDEGLLFCINKYEKDNK